MTATITAPTFTEEYASLTLLTESQLHDLVTSIEAYITGKLITNMEQLAIDAFGSSYVFNDDGSQTVTPSLAESFASLTEDVVVAGSWTFQNPVTFSDPVTSSSTFTSTGQMRARAFLNAANQTLSDTTSTIVNFDGETYDVGAMHDLVTNNSRIIIPAGGDGLYSFNAQATFTANATGRREIAIWKNGSKIAETKLFSNDASEQTVLQVSCHDTASAADYYQVKVYQNSGGTLDLVKAERVTFFSAMKVW